MTYYSDPFDITDYSNLNAEIQVYGLVGTAPSVVVTIETAASLSKDDSQWSNEWSFTTFTSAPVAVNDPVGAPDPTGWLGRFVRAKVRVNAPDTAVTLSVTGVARES